MANVPAANEAVMTTTLADVSIISFVVVSLFSSVVQPQSQRLQLERLKIIGTVTLASSAYACFDPGAAVQIDQDVRAGAADTSTREAFAVGTCIILKTGEHLSAVEQVIIAGGIFLRATPLGTKLRVYLPFWSAKLPAIGDDRYDAAKVELLSPMRSVADHLAMRVAVMARCHVEFSDLAARINLFNQRAAKYADHTANGESNTRVKGGGGIFPIVIVEFPDPMRVRLARQAARLRTESDALWQQCAKYAQGMQLDEDYIVYRRIPGES